MVCFAGVGGDVHFVLSDEIGTFVGVLVHVDSEDPSVVDIFRFRPGVTFVSRLPELAVVQEHEDSLQWPKSSACQYSTDTIPKRT